MRTKLSTLWIFILFNMIFADIVGYMNPGALEDIIAGSLGIEITEELLLLFSVLLLIPISMVVLSRTLNHQVNRWANITASVITIIYVIGGADPYLSYKLFATVEVLTMLYIIWLAWRWTDQLET